jgi:hypothetical protein
VAVLEHVGFDKHDGRMAYGGDRLLALEGQAEPFGRMRMETIAVNKRTHTVNRFVHGAPVTWGELEQGAGDDEFSSDDLSALIRSTGNQWASFVAARRRFRLERLFLRG